MLGDYHGYNIETPNILEKQRGEPFSKTDYQKLDKILQDNYSPFKDISINDIIKVSNTDGVDAVSGATTIILGEDAIVRGAAFPSSGQWVD
jgi:hypothetical protein